MTESMASEDEISQKVDEVTIKDQGHQRNMKSDDVEVSWRHVKSLLKLNNQQTWE